MENSEMFNKTNNLEAHLKDLEEKQIKEFEELEDRNHEKLLILSERIDFIDEYGQTGLKGKPYVGEVDHNSFYYDIGAKIFISEDGRKTLFINQLIKIGLYYAAYNAVSDCDVYLERYNKHIEQLISERKEEFNSLGIQYYK